MSSNYKNLIVWQKAFKISIDIYKLSKKFPKEELFSITSQIRRSAISVPSNIAEGQGRSSKKDFIRFLNIAKGSCNELETQLLISKELGYINQEDLNQIQVEIIEVLKIISTLIKKLKTNN